MTSRRARRALLSLFFALGVLSIAPITAAQGSDKKARQLYIEGDKAYAEGRYEQALEAFQQAFELSSRPALLYNIGNAFERLGRHREAAEALEEYLPHAKASEKNLIKKRVENLKKRAEEQERAEQSKPPSEEPRDAPEQEPEPAPEPPEKPAPAPAEPEQTGGSSTVGWVLLGAGGAVIVGGAIAGVIALGARSDADAGCSDSGGKRLCTGEARDAIDRDKTFSLLADVGFGVGAVAAGIGIYLIVDAGSEAEPHTSALRASPRSGGGELQFVTTF